MIAVLGAGAMGAALATHLVRGGQRLVLLATERDEATVRAWRSGHPHPGLGVVLHPGIVVQDLADAQVVLGEAEMIAVAVSSSGLAPVLHAAAGCASPDAVWVLATKGWQEETYLAPSELARTIVGAQAPIVTLAGPGLASELEAGLPTALLCASRNVPARRWVAKTLTSPSMLVVTTSDVAGAETASAYKNVAAIAVGIAEGLSQRFADGASRRTFANARAAMFAQGMMDMVRLAEASGGRPATVHGLAGAGDLYVTCVGGRNGRFGKLLGSGCTTEQALQAINSTVEGVANTRVALGLGERHSIDLPTARAVDLALHHHLTGDRGTQEFRNLFSATMWPQYAFP
jgi:glycerol-3-phosphate dehydrogenase (NAD(P)+)